MSIDNYFVIDKIDENFVVSEGSASDESNTIYPQKKFGTLLEAKHWAEKQECEYGIRITDECLK